MLLLKKHLINPVIRGEVKFGAFLWVPIRLISTFRSFFLFMTVDHYNQLHSSLC